VEAQRFFPEVRTSGDLTQLHYSVSVLPPRRHREEGLLGNENLTIEAAHTAKASGSLDK